MYVLSIKLKVVLTKNYTIQFVSNSLVCFIWEVKVAEDEAFNTSLSSAKLNCRRSKGSILQSHSTSIESWVLCNSASSLTVKIILK